MLNVKKAPPRRDSASSFESAASFESKTSSQEAEANAKRMDKLITASEVRADSIKRLAEEGPIVTNNNKMRPSLEVELVSGDLEERKERMSMAAKASRPTLQVKHKANATVYKSSKKMDKKEMAKAAQKLLPERGNAFFKRSGTSKKTKKILDDYEDDDDTKLELALRDGMPKEERIIVIDFGTGMVKAGTHEMPKPLLHFHNRVVTYETEWIEDEKYAVKQNAEYAYPLIEARIDDW